MIVIKLRTFNKWRQHGLATNVVKMWCHDTGLLTYLNISLHVGSSLCLSTILWWEREFLLTVKLRICVLIEMKFCCIGCVCYMLLLARILFNTWYIAKIFDLAMLVWTRVRLGFWKLLNYLFKDDFVRLLRLLSY